MMFLVSFIYLSLSLYNKAQKSIRSKVKYLFDDRRWLKIYFLWFLMSCLLHTEFVSCIDNRTTRSEAGILGRQPYMQYRLGRQHR